MTIIGSSYDRMTSLDDLPLEILLLVISHLKTQYELLHLSLVNKKLHDLSIPRVYSSITLNTSFNTLDKEFEWLANIDGYSTYIKTSKSILKLFRVIDSKNENYSKLIQSFKVVQVPDEYIEFQSHLCNVLPKLTNLQKLDLYGIPLNVSIINYLNSKTLTELMLSFEHGQFKRSFKSPSRESIALSTHPMESDFQLNTLVVDQVSRPSELQHYLETLVKHNSKLKHLKIDEAHFGQQPIPLDLSWLSFKNLTSFSLKNHDFIETDISILHHFKNLEFLELDNITQPVAIQGRSPLFSPRTLYTNCASFPNLKTLKLDLRGSMILAFTGFFNDMTAPRLENLDIHFSGLDLTLEDTVHVAPLLYTDKICTFKDNLVTLSFIISVNDTQSASSQIVPARRLLECFFPKLKNFTHSIPFFSISEYNNRFPMSKLFPNLENLGFMIQESHTSHMGLGTAFAGVYDEWLRLLHVPRDFISSCYNNQPQKLKYINIDNHVFEVITSDDGKIVVEPRTTIGEWFIRNTRVSFRGLIPRG